MRTRHTWLVLLLVVVVGILSGCGGSGSSLTTTRVLAGFVYTKGNTIGAGPDVVVTSSANPPTGYFAPSSGTVTLSVADGTLTRAPGSAAFDMSVSNAIVVTAKAAASSSVGVSGTNIVLNGTIKALTPYSVNLGLASETGTVKLITSPAAPLYTPGAPVSLKYMIDGNVPVDPKELFIAGAPVGPLGDRTLAMVGLDSNGVINPTSTFTVTSTTNGVLITGTGSSVTLSPGNAASSSIEGDTTVSVALTGQNVAGSFLANFSYGTIGVITTTSSAPSLLWNTAGVPATVTVTGLVKNTYGAAMFGKTVAWTDPTHVSANAWATQSASTAFTVASADTDTAGTVSTTLTAPTSAAAGGGLTLTPKGDNVVTATSGLVSGTVTVKVIRPLSTVAIAGPARIDIGTTTPSTGTGAFSVTSAVDVDGANVPPSDYTALALTYTCSNVAGGAPYGNIGDLSAKTTSGSSILGGAGNENRVVAGNVAGQITVQVTAGVPVPSNTITTEVFGDPVKIFLNPNTNTTNSVPGSLGNYTAAPGTQLASSFTLMDTGGHTIPAQELSYQTIFILQSGTGGSVSPGGSNVSNFTLTFGGFDGLLDINLINGTWSSAGGSRNFDLNKVIGHDSN